MSGTPSAIFYTPARRIRFYVKGTLFIALLGGGMILTIYLPRFDAFRFEYFTAGIVLASFVLIRFIEKRPVASLGLAWNAFTTRHVYGGFLIGAFMITAVVTGIVGLGDANIEAGYLTWDSALRLCANQFVTFLFAAAVEEMLCRGYLFQAAMESSNARWR